MGGFPGFSDLGLGCGQGWGRMLFAASGTDKSFQMGSYHGSKDQRTKLRTVPKWGHLGTEMQKQFLWAPSPTLPPHLWHFRLVYGF